MRRFFLQNDITDVMKIDGADAWHIKKVLRMKIGEKIQVIGRCGKIAEAEIIGFETKNILLRLLRLIKNNVLLNEFGLCLIQGLAKGDKIDYIVQKSVEIGVENIILYGAQNSVVKLSEEKASQKLRRWQKIAYEAAKQCGSNFLTQVFYEENLLKAICRFYKDLKPDADKKKVIILYEKEKKRGIKELVTNIKKHKSSLVLAVVVGPEGGLTSDEVETVAQFFPEAECATLGERILRTETAAITASAILLYEFIL